MRKFNVSLNGYNKLEVNNFVNEVTSEYESMLSKLKKQDEEIARLKNDLEKYKNMENNVTIQRPNGTIEIVPSNTLWELDGTEAKSTFFVYE